MATNLRKLDGYPPESSSYALYHDADNLVITTHSVILTVAEASHLMVDVGCDLYISNLLINSAAHDHVADHIYNMLGTHVLAMASTYHLHRIDATYASPIYTIGSNPLTPLKLPDLRSSGQSGERGATVSGGLLLPGVSVSARFGSKMSATLPVVQGSGSATQLTPMSVDGTLPSLSGTSRAGIRCGTLRLPTMEISASTESVHICTLDRNLPGLTVEATGLETNLSSLIANLPAMQATITIDAEIWMSLEAIVSPPTLSATMSGVLSMNMEGLLPAFIAVSAAENTSLSVIGYIPPPVIIGAGEGIGSATLEDTTRYDDLVLRYAR